MLQNPSDSDVKPTDVFSLKISKRCYHRFSDCTGMKVGLMNIRNENN